MGLGCWHSVSLTLSLSSFLSVSFNLLSFLSSMGDVSQYLNWLRHHQVRKNTFIPRNAYHLFQCRPGIVNSYLFVELISRVNALLRKEKMSAVSEIEIIHIRLQKMHRSVHMFWSKRNLKTKKNHKGNHRFLGT